MTLGVVIAVGLGGAAGSVLRVWLDGRLAPPHPFRIPRGTLLVNVLGSLVLGAAIGASGSLGLGHAVQTMVAAGLCGGLSTYSSLAVATASLWREDRRWAALLNLSLNVLLGWGGAAVGLTAAAWMTWRLAGG
ncbi:CrcB family protein [Zhihengliuella sp.]|uniref:fluoride efflux transporter FluC n=1 Tax=Zhihengliuella sp. TaxID=1954483 RepID=UPI002811C9E4|nr:CrcB family protein [Zhihengliuella sp.]